MGGVVGWGGGVGWWGGGGEKLGIKLKLSFSWGLGLAELGKKIFRTWNTFSTTDYNPVSLFMLIL